MRKQQRGSGPRGASRRGSALVLSLIAVVTVVVLAASFSQFTSSVANRQTQAVHRKRAFYLAEAGLTEAFAGLSQGKSGNVGSEASPALLGDGVFWVAATEPDPGYVRLESTGMIGTGKVELSLVAKRGEDSVAALGVFAKGSLTIGVGSLIDAYDSSKGSYASQTDHSGASLGSNANITVAGTVAKPSTIKGDVTPGPDKAVNTSGTVTITGSTTAAMVSTDLPAITAPDVTLGAAVVQSSPYPLVIPAGTIGYQSLTVQTGTQAIIQGPATVKLGSLTVAGTGQLTFDTTHGPIELTVTDAIACGAQSSLSTSGTRPQDVTIQVPGPTVASLKLRSVGPFYGVIYAPQAQVTVGTAFEVYGALVANSLTFDGAAKLHFDQHLAQLAAEAALPRTLSWRLISLESSSSDLATDPFVLLGLNKSLLPAPKAAHADQNLSIDYYDASNVYHRYVGLESHFDWNVVKTVIAATRDGYEVLFPLATTPKIGAKKSPGVLPVIDGPMI